MNSPNPPTPIPQLFDTAGIVTAAADQGGNYFHTLMVNKLLTSKGAGGGVGGNPPKTVYEDLLYSRHFLPGEAKRYRKKTKATDPSGPVAFENET